MKYYDLPWSTLRSLGYAGPDVHSGLRINGEKVEKPEDADVVLIPLSPRTEVNDSMTPELWVKIVNALSIDPRRLASFDCSDFDFQTDQHADGMFIRCNLKSWHKRRMPKSIAWPWPVGDFKDIIDPPADGFKYDVSGHMWLSSNVRHHACESVGFYAARGVIKADLVTRKEFYGYIERDEPERAKLLMAAFKKSMQESRVALCPRSIAEVFPYRFYEAMSAGRVPVLICDDHQFPFREEIPYEEFCILLPEVECGNAGLRVAQEIQNLGTERLISMGLRARVMWEKWLNRDKWTELFTYAIEKALRSEGLLK